MPVCGIQFGYFSTSYRYHGSRHAWEQDRLRDREARQRGDLIVRYTYDGVHRRASSTAREVRSILTDRRHAVASQDALR